MADVTHMPFFIADAHTGYVLLWLRDETLTRHLTAGVLDTQDSMVAPQWARRIDPTFEHIFRDGEVTRAPEQPIPEESADKRAILRARHDAAQWVLFFGSRQAARAKVNQDPRLEAALIYAVCQSSPPEVFHPLVHEYATLAGLPAARAFDEMKMHADSMAMVSVRNYLFVQRAMAAINKTTTPDDAMAAAREVWAGARSRL